MMKSSRLLLLALIVSASALESVRPQSTNGGEAGVNARSLAGISVYTDKTKWNAAMVSAGFTVVENDLSPLVEGESDGEIVLPKKATTDVGLFDINLDDNTLDNWVWKYEGNIAYEGYYSSSNGIKFENFEGGVACGFAGTWRDWKDDTSKKELFDGNKDIIIKVNDSSLNLSDMLKYYDKFIGIVVTEGFDTIEFLSPDHRVMFELYDILLSVNCVSPNPSQAPTLSAKPTSSPAPTATISASPTASPSISSSPTATPTTKTTIEEIIELLLEFILELLESLFGEKN